MNLDNTHTTNNRNSKKNISLENQIVIENTQGLRQKMSHFVLPYKFGINNLSERISILSEEFELTHDYNPIEHIRSRLKTPESILKKLKKSGHSPNFFNMKQHINDIAGVRIICSFKKDTYRISQLIKAQKDITIIEIKDYIKNPKPNGYKSLHMILSLPVFLSSGTENIKLELQIRTISMDFWASLEHKIYYKYDKKIPSHISNELKKAAQTANTLDITMENLQDETQKIKNTHKN